MNTTKATTCLATVLFTMLGCSERETNQERHPTPEPEERASFVNRVWRVSESSSVSPGHLYVFLSEGTLVVASPNSKPALGTWKGEGDSLTMVEEGIPYKVDVLGLTKSEFRIKSHNPGEPVEIRFVPAEESTTAKRP